jgi:hypothetical protein
MGGKNSSRWRGHRREPSVEETWEIDCSRFSPFLAKGNKSHLGEIQVTRKTPPGSFPAEFVLKDKVIRFHFWKHGQRGDIFILQKINVKAFNRKGFFQSQWLFECPHCNEYFEKLYMRDDDRYNDEEFCCRNGIGLTYASRLKGRLKKTAQ